VKLASKLDTAMITADMARELAIAQKVCVRPVLRRVEDRQTGAKELIAIACGSTREAVCPSCAHKAKVLRMQAMRRRLAPHRRTPPARARGSRRGRPGPSRQ
jgi:hypothetical protein